MFASLPKILIASFFSLRRPWITAITSIATQNIIALTAVQDVKPDIEKAQIEAVVEDSGVDA